MLGQIEKVWNDITYEIRRYYTWIRWGFDPHDIWSLDITCAQFLIPRLKKIKEYKQGVPSCFVDGEDEKAIEEGRKQFEAELDKMILAFETIINNCCIYTPEQEKIINEGLQSFIDYYGTLWT